MAQNKNAASSAPNHTSAEIREWYEKNKKNLENYEAANNALKQLRDVTKSTTKSITAFSKESLRTYLTNIGSNENNLRKLSRYLYYRSHVYFRIIKFFANMFDLKARYVIPSYDPTADNDRENTIKSFYDTLTILDNMNLQFEMLKMYVLAFREDAAYGCAFYDETGLFILTLDPEYCKIDGSYFTGDFSFSMDMTYWRSRQTELEWIGDPFTSMYREYESSGVKWVHMPDEYAVCLKFRAEDYDLIVPPFSGIFNSLLSLIDLEDIQAIADEQQVYKMIYLPMETLSGTKDVDDWCISPDIMVEYFNRMVEDALPDYTSAAIVPGKELKTIDFNNDQATDTDKVLKATETVLNTAGGAETLNGSSISTTAAFNAAMKANTEFAISTLLPQTQSWTNRFLSYQLSSAAKVKFFEISIYTRDDFRKNMLESAQYGFQKLAYNTLNGISELDTLALNFLEQECLGITDKLVPLKSSYTSSSNDQVSGEVGQGAPTKDDGELTDEGDKSRNR